jgi:hypothetical protein
MILDLLHELKSFNLQSDCLVYSGNGWQRISVSYLPSLLGHTNHHHHHHHHHHHPKHTKYSTARLCRPTHLVKFSLAALFGNRPRGRQVAEVAKTTHDALRLISFIGRLVFERCLAGRRFPLDLRQLITCLKSVFVFISLLCCSLDSSLLEISNWNRQSTIEPLNRMSNPTPCLGIFGIDAFNHSHEKIMQTFTECLQENLRLSTAPICWQAEPVLVLACYLTYGKCHWRLAAFAWECPSKRIPTIPRHFWTFQEPWGPASHVLIMTKHASLRITDFDWTAGPLDCAYAIYRSNICYWTHGHCLRF